jgi:hypothetical protein
MAAKVESADSCSSNGKGKGKAGEPVAAVRLGNSTYWERAGRTVCNRVQMELAASQALLALNGQLLY